MISVLGLPLDHAKELLMLEGISVTFEEARSKKGVEGATEARVIRQTLTEEGHALIVYSIFKTEPMEANT